DTLENHIGNRWAKPLPRNPPSGPKWKAKQGMARLNLNGAEYSVLACLIDRASKAKGACYPSQEFICKWTCRPERTVKRAIETLQQGKLIQVIDRGFKSNAYLVNWPPLFQAYSEMKACEHSHASQKVAPQVQAVGPEMAPHVRPEVAHKPTKG